MASFRLLPRAVKVLVVALGIAALAVLVLWVLPVVLTRHPSQGLSDAERLKAANDVRAPLVTFVVAVGAAGTLWFTSRSYLLSRDAQVTDRFTRAVDHLGDASPAVRIGGVYALERIGNDSGRDLATVVDVLGAFIRDRSTQMRQRQDELDNDVRAALEAGCRLVQQQRGATLDLTDAYLANADLSRFSPSQVSLDRANIDGARLPTT